MTIGFNVVGDLYSPGRVAGATSFWNDEGADDPEQEPGSTCPGRRLRCPCPTRSSSCATVRHPEAGPGTRARSSGRARPGPRVHPLASAAGRRRSRRRGSRTRSEAGDNPATALLPAFRAADGSASDAHPASLAKWGVLGRPGSGSSLTRPMSPRRSTRSHAADAASAPPRRPRDRRNEGHERRGAAVVVADRRRGAAGRSRAAPR